MDDTYYELATKLAKGEITFESVINILRLKEDLKLEFMIFYSAYKEVLEYENNK